MNYLEQINAFWIAHDEHMFTTTEVALYFNLLKICNSARWTNPFNRHSSMIAVSMGISKSTFEKSRNRLRDAGIIEYKTVIGSSNIRFTLIDLHKYYGGQHGGSARGKHEGGANTAEGTNHIGNNGLNINTNKTKINRNIYKGFAHLELFEDEFHKLISLGFSKEQIDKVLDDIENYADNKKYTSLFITAKNWLNSQKEKSSEKKEKEPVGTDQLSKKEEKQRIEKVLDAFDTYKVKGKFHDLDNVVYNILYKKGLINFSNERNIRILTSVVNTAKSDEGRLSKILELEKAGRLNEDKEILADAMQLALIEFFNDLAEVGKELKDIIHCKQQ